MAKKKLIEYAVKHQNEVDKLSESAKKAFGENRTVSVFKWMYSLAAAHKEFVSELDDISTLLDNGVTEQQQWISVEDERKPKDRKNYFIAYVFGDSDMHFFGEAKYHAYEGNDIVDRPHFSNEGVNGMTVTHWMEIPKLPPVPMRIRRMNHG